MRTIEVVEIPFGSAPRHFRKSLIGLRLEADDPPDEPELVDCLPGERSSPGYCVPISAVVEKLQGNGQKSAATYFNSLRTNPVHPYSHLVINASACVPL